MELLLSSGAPAKGEARVVRGEGMRLDCFGENAPNFMLLMLPAGTRVLELLELPAGEKIARGDCKDGYGARGCCCWMLAKGSTGMTRSPSACGWATLVSSHPVHLL